MRIGSSPAFALFSDVNANMPRGVLCEIIMIESGSEDDDIAWNLLCMNEIAFWLTLTVEQQTRVVEWYNIRSAVMQPGLSDCEPITLAAVNADVDQVFVPMTRASMQEHLEYMGIDVFSEIFGVHEIDDGAELEQYRLRNMSFGLFSKMDAETRTQAIAYFRSRL